jgi:hypothetical protein
MQVKKILKTAVFTAFVLLVFSFTLNSCKTCDKNKKPGGHIDRSQTPTPPASDVSKQQENLKKKQEEDRKRQEEAECQRLVQGDDRERQEEAERERQRLTQGDDRERQEKAERERLEEEECRENVKNKAGSAAEAAMDVAYLVMFENNGYNMADVVPTSIFDLASRARFMYEEWQKCAGSFNSAMVLGRKMKVDKKSLDRAKDNEKAMIGAWSFDKIKSQVVAVGSLRGNEFGNKFGKALNKLSRLMCEADRACNEFAVLYELEPKYRMLDHQEIINGIERILEPYKKKK